MGGNGDEAIVRGYGVNPRRSATPQLNGHLLPPKRHLVQGQYYCLRRHICLRL